jgi:hypothetical protein
MSWNLLSFWFVFASYAVSLRMSVKNPVFAVSAIFDIFHFKLGWRRAGFSLCWKGERMRVMESKLALNMPQVSMWYGGRVRKAHKSVRSLCFYPPNTFRDFPRSWILEIILQLAIPRLKVSLEIKTQPNQGWIKFHSRGKRFCRETSFKRENDSEMKINSNPKIAGSLDYLAEFVRYISSEVMGYCLACPYR